MRPQCKRCSFFGVTCNYLLQVPDLQPVSADTRWQIKDQARRQLSISLETPVYTADGLDTFYMTPRHQEYVFRYLGRGPTLISNDPNTKELNLGLLELCFVVGAPISSIVSTYQGKLRLRDALAMANMCVAVSQPNACFSSPSSGIRPL